MTAVVGGGVDERHGELPLVVAQVVVLVVRADEVDVSQLGLFRHGAATAAAAAGRRRDDRVVVQSRRLPSETIF